MKEILIYNFDFGMELIEYMLNNDKSHIVRAYAKDLLLEISAIDLTKPFDQEPFELIDETIYRSIKKFLEYRNIAKITSYIKKPTALAAVKRKANESILKADSIETPEPVVKRKILTHLSREDVLIEKIATCETEILGLLLDNRIGSKSIFEILKSVEKKEIPLSQVFKNSEDLGVDESSQFDNCVEIINTIKETHKQNEQLRKTLFEPSIKEEDKKKIRRNISRQSKKLRFLLSDWHLKEDILGSIENVIKDEIDWYKEAKKVNLEEDSIREREVTLKVNFKALIRNMVEIQRRRMTIRQAKEELIRLTLPLVSRIAKNYPSYGLEKEDLLGEGRIGLVVALNSFDFRKGHKFSDFSIWWIHHSIMMAIVDHNKITMDIPENIIEEIVELNTVSKNLVYKLGREPTANEIADEMDVAVDKVESILLSAIEPVEVEKETAESNLAANIDLDTVKEMIKVVHIPKKPKAKVKQEGVSAEGIKRKAKPLTKKLSEKELKERTEFSIKRQLEKRISDREVKTRPVYLQLDMPTEQVPSSTYTRNPYVSELAKRRAKGYCQLCKKPAPFNDKDGNPFLETHHVVWLSQGGEDTIENTVALCPNCHRKMHSLNLKLDQKKLKSIAQQQKHDPNP
jgi:RNA polymerase sigma factor (sigma-70 family)